MRHAHTVRFSSHNGDGLFFSVALTGAILAIVSALFAIDMATVRALLSLP